MRVSCLAVTLAMVTASLLVTSTSAAQAQNVPLLLFGGKNDREFAGCLNCGKYDDESVCNKYGDYGSKYNDKSIWNKYGTFGSKYNLASPWNAYGEGLAIVDSDGNFYGRLTLSNQNQSRLSLAKGLLSAYKSMQDLDALRDLLCES